MRKNKIITSDNQELFSRSYREPVLRFEESLWQIPQPAYPVPLRLDTTGITRRDPNYHIRRPDGDFYYVLEYIIAGHGTLLIDGHTYHPAANDVYMLPPEVPHEYYSDRDDPWEKIWFNVSGSLIDQLLIAYNLPGAIYLKNAESSFEYFKQGLELGKKPPVNAYTELAALLHRIIATIAVIKFEQHEQQVSPEAMMLKEHLDNHWQESITMEQLSRVIDKSPVQTLRIFKRDWQTTPNLYLQQRKLTMAKQYLTNSSYPVRSIAGLLGFQNEFHFSTWFKRQCGLSPKFYRHRQPEA